MNIIRRRGWEIPESQLTPEHLAFNRRKLLIGGAAAMALSPVALSPVAAQAQRVTDVATLPDPTADLYPAKLNAKYKLDRQSPTRRSTATIIISTNSASRRPSPARRRR